MSETTSYTVQGMTCAHCTGAVGAAVKALDGVASVDVDLATGVVSVVASGTDGARIRAAIRDAGYEVA